MGLLSVPLLQHTASPWSEGAVSPALRRACGSVSVVAGRTTRSA